jgi:hypothetical protein
MVARAQYLGARVAHSGPNSYRCRLIFLPFARSRGASYWASFMISTASLAGLLDAISSLVSAIVNADIY